MAAAAAAAAPVAAGEGGREEHPSLEEGIDDGGSGSLPGVYRDRGIDENWFQVRMASHRICHTGNGLSWISFPS